MGGARAVEVSVWAQEDDAPAAAEVSEDSTSPEPPWRPPLREACWPTSPGPLGQGSRKADGEGEGEGESRAGAAYAPPWRSPPRTPPSWEAGCVT